MSATDDPILHAQLQALAEHLLRSGRMLVTAESCTGGLLAAACTELPGSSRWFERGLVTYSNAAKQQLLGVPAALIEREGAVSQAVALAMAHGALAHTPAQLSVAITGIAGPDGGSPAKPVGTVWFAWGNGQTLQAQRCQFEGDRTAIRQAAMRHALARLLEF
ncbi:CinA family protein [Vandammella animalimorsus]|uniref:CinA family protein n=1 Tax=Vandammella animalimorsus TaxID=2029117 RepID=UPI0031BB25E0